MKSKKLLAVLAKLITCGALIGGCVSLTACEDFGGNNGGTPAHTTHTWSTTKYGKDDKNHWRECTHDGCDEISQVEPHDFTKGNCVCGQSKPEEQKPEKHEHVWSTTAYGKDDKNHWRECTGEDCDEVSQVEPHDFTKGNCVCGQPKPGEQKPEKHEHTWSTMKYGKDDKNHWRECTGEDCDEISQVEPHDFTNGNCVCGQPKPEEQEPVKDGLVSITAYDHTQDGNRVTLRVQKLFKVGDTFNSKNLSVRAKKRVDGKEVTEDVSTAVTVSKPDMTTAGEKTVTVSYGGKKTSYTINVIDLSGVSKNGASVTVNQTATVGVSGNVVTVNSINDAVTVFKLLGTDDNTVKTINLVEGVYHEKVEFDIPNLHIVGAKADATKTVIEYDLIAEYVCPGTTAMYSTDGSATVSIRAEGMGFHAENVTFQNYWNTHERYLQSVEIANGLVPSNESRKGNTMAVACLVQADKCVFDNVRFSSYHDTLYDYNGRHVYNNCFIEGRTDYIFGYGATSYFNNCTLNTIGADDARNGGYVCATMGYSKYTPAGTTPTTVIDYGYIFKGCTFTADNRVKNGTASLARSWSSYMTLAFIECNISAAYSKTAYGTKIDNKNERYGEMSSGKPDAHRLYEYGNTGAGALDYAALGAGLQKNLCTVLTEAEKENFCNFNVIFAAVNGQIEYSSAWNGNAGVIIPATYNFSDLGPQASSWSNAASAKPLFDGAMTIKGQYKPNGNSVQVKAGTVIKIESAGKIIVDWFGNNYGTEKNGKIVYKNGYATITIIDDTASTGGIYIKSITVDGTQPGVHQHEYGGWNITQYPTDSAGGTAKRTCQDCELATAHVDSKVLPALSADNYDITSSQNQGKSIYTLKADKTISFEANALAGVHVHHYGAWEVKEANKPTANAAGAVTRTCTDADCNHDGTATESKVLPKLDDKRYTVTNDNATVESTGTGTYTITVDGITNPVSFTAPTPKLTTTTFNFADYDASSKPASFFDGKVTVNSNYWLHGEAIKVSTGDTIVLNVKGKISIDWWGGSLGSESNGEISYKDGYATIKIVDAGSGVYIKSITVDHTDVQPDTV